MKKLDLIVGARPNFIKISPIIDALHNSRLLSYRLVHTGQHYDTEMSKTFFDQLGIPEPDVNLNCGSGTQAEQCASIMVNYEKLLLNEMCDLCLVVGDVNSTMACTITARKLGVSVAHVEGGIRSMDWTMPEEINRVVTDSISNYFFTTSDTANRNLLDSGIEKDNIFFVGNTMIDSLLKNKPRFIKPVIWKKEDLENKGYIVMTLHRPSNVDNAEKLKVLIDEITNECGECKVIFPVHPRTRITLDKIESLPSNMIFVDSMPYLEFNYLVQHALGVITDSGGITEETTVLGVPCITLRNSTERPETVTFGTNVLVGDDKDDLIHNLRVLLSGSWKESSIPPLWDGASGKRIVECLQNIMFTKEDDK
tara:strand:+ start:1634 stop:2734 length:1101 start_codon:yes stop_codon:yes gene_type:complete